LSVVKTAEREQARELRARGLSIKEIERQLNVARSSVSAWVRDVELEPAARARLVKRTRIGPQVAAVKKAERARRIRSWYQDDGRALACIEGPAYAAGCMLYWAEGSKLRNDVQISNADPELVVHFVKFLRLYFDVARDRMRLQLHLFADHEAQQVEVESFWLTRLGLPRSSLTKTQLNKYSKYSQKKRCGKLPYGTARLSVHSTQIVQTIYGSIQEYGGFERPEWLD
jgi:hypothetical protein